MSDVDIKVKQYQVKFNELRLALQERAVIHTEVTVLRVLDVIGGLCVLYDFLSLSTANMTCKQLRKFG